MIPIDLVQGMIRSHLRLDNVEVEVNSAYGWVYKMFHRRVRRQEHVEVEREFRGRILGVDLKGFGLKEVLNVVQRRQTTNSRARERDHYLLEWIDVVSVGLEWARR